MARAGDGTNANYFSVAAVPFTAAPFSISVWGNLGDNTSDRTLASVTDTASTNESVDIRCRGATANDPLTFNRRAGGVANFLDISPGPVAGSWFHALGVGAAANDARLYLNGGNKVTTTTSRAPASLDTTAIGTYKDSGGATRTMNGSICEVAFWNVALDDTDAVELSKGASPLLVQTSGLVAYYRLTGRMSPELDAIGGVGAMTMTGTMTQAAHCPSMIYPYARRGGFLGASSVTVNVDELAPTQWVLFRNVDELVHARWGGVLTKDENLPVQWSLSIFMDDSAPIEYNLAVVQSETLPLAWKPLLGIDALLPISHSLTRDAREKLPISWLAPGFFVVQINALPGVAHNIGRENDRLFSGSNFAKPSIVGSHGLSFQPPSGNLLLGGPSGVFNSRRFRYATLRLKVGEIVVSEFVASHGDVVFSNWIPESPISTNWE